MVIQKATHKICKTVQKTSFRKSVKQLFDDLEPNASTFLLNSIAFALNRQFYGYALPYLEVYEQGQSMLSPEDINVLIKAHKFLLETTEDICRLDDILPTAQAAISPYSDCQVNFSNLLVLPEVDDSGTLHKALEELKQDFKKHPALGILSDCISHLNGHDNFEEEALVEIVLNYRHKIINQGFSEVDDNLMFELFNKQDLTQFYISRLVRSLIVLRDSLSNISQFIYQAFRYEKPIILNRENVFDCEGVDSNRLGKTSFLLVQPIGKEADLWTGDFVIVSLDLVNLVEDGFYRVEKIDKLDSSDFGSSTRFSLRKIDENMVCYPQLLYD